MSARLLIILEDPTHDRYIVKPLIERLVAAVGKRRARVHVLIDPRMGGVEQVLNKETRTGILTKYPMIDVFVVVVDRDCVDGREKRLADFSRDVVNKGSRFAGVLAVEEVEVWLLAGFLGQLPAPWLQIRGDCYPKENFFDEFLQNQNLPGVGGGRAALMKKTLNNLAGLQRRCPEIAELREQLSNAL